MFLRRSDIVLDLNISLRANRQYWSTRYQLHYPCHVCRTFESNLTMQYGFSMSKQVCRLYFVVVFVTGMILKRHTRSSEGRTGALRKSILTWLDRLCRAWLSLVTKLLTWWQKHHDHRSHTRPEWESNPHRLQPKPQYILLHQDCYQYDERSLSFMLWDVPSTTYHGLAMTLSNVNTSQDTKRQTYVAEGKSTLWSWKGVKCMFGTLLNVNSTKSWK